MKPPKLTPEQKEQFRLANRSLERINETWTLFTMFLSQEKRPAEALLKAQEAVDIWATWMDEYNRIEPPDIEPSPQIDFVEGVKAASRELIREMRNDKEFISELRAEYDPPALPECPTDQRQNEGHTTEGPV